MDQAPHPPSASVGETPPAGLRIFINYRRGETAAHAGRLYDALSARFGEGYVFMDIDRVALGADFMEVINRAVGSCDVLIAIVGRGWLEVQDSRGRRRLENPDDYVRLEIESALAGTVVVIPALVEDAEMPSPSDLPEALAPFARRNGIPLRDIGWRRDVESLVTALEEIADKKARLATAHQAPERAGQERPAQEAAEWPTPPKGPAPSVVTGTRRRLVAIVAVGLLMVGLVVTLLALNDTSSEHEPVNPAGEIIGRPIPVGKGAVGVTFGANAIWATSSNDGTVTRIDPDSAEPGKPITVGASAAMVAQGAGYVWVVTPGGVRRINPTSEKAVPGTIRVGRGRAFDVAVGAGGVWVTTTTAALEGRVPQEPDSVRRIDPSTYRAGRPTPIPREPRTSGSAAVAVDSHHGVVWLAHSSGVLTRLEDVGYPIGEAGPGPFRAHPLRLGGESSGVATGAGAVWVPNNSDGTVTRIDLVRRSHTQGNQSAFKATASKPIRVGGYPSGVAVQGHSVWILGISSVTRLNARTKRVVGTPIRLRAPAVDIAVGAGFVWVTSDGTVTRIKPGS